MSQAVSVAVLEARGSSGRHWSEEEKLDAFVELQAGEVRQCTSALSGTVSKPPSWVERFDFQLDLTDFLEVRLFDLVLGNDPIGVAFLKPFEVVNCETWIPLLDTTGCQIAEIRLLVTQKPSTAPVLFSNGVTFSILEVVGVENLEGASVVIEIIAAGTSMRTEPAIDPQNPKWRNSFFEIPEDFFEIILHVGEENVGRALLPCIALQNRRGEEVWVTLTKDGVTNGKILLRVHSGRQCSDPLLIDNLAEQRRFEVEKAPQSPKPLLLENSKPIFVLRVVGCENLSFVNSEGQFPHAFVQVTIGNETQKTKTLKETINPLFNEELVFTADDQNLFVCVIDERYNIELGNSSVPIQEIQQLKADEELEVVLLDKEKYCTGTVILASPLSIKQSIPTCVFSEKAQNILASRVAPESFSVTSNDFTAIPLGSSVRRYGDGYSLDFSFGNHAYCMPPPRFDNYGCSASFSRCYPPPPGLYGYPSAHFRDSEFRESPFKAVGDHYVYRSPTSITGRQQQISPSKTQLCSASLPLREQLRSSPFKTLDGHHLYMPSSPARHQSPLRKSQSPVRRQISEILLSKNESKKSKGIISEPVRKRRPKTAKQQSLSSEETKPHVWGAPILSRDGTRKSNLQKNLPGLTISFLSRS